MGSENELFLLFLPERCDTWALSSLSCAELDIKLCVELAQKRELVDKYAKAA
jgi:hypothetical protein